MEVQLRKHQNMLVIIGSGVISFGMWSAIKMVLYGVMGRSELREIIAEQGVSEDVQGILLIIMYLFIGIGLAFALALRSYIGLSARAEGMGKKRGYGYIIAASLLMLVDTSIFALAAYYMFTTPQNIDDLLDRIVSAIVELTSLVTLAELVYSAIRVRQLTRTLSE